MKKIITALVIQFVCVFAFAQIKITPGDKSLNKSLIKQGKFTMGYYVVQEGVATEICVYEVEVKFSSQKLHVNTSLNFLKSTMQWKEGIAIDEHSFKTVSRKSERDTRTFTLNFSDNITGEITDNKTGKNKPVKLPVTESYFDIATYPYVVCALPLTTGYKAIIPVIDYDAKDKSKVYNVIITEVKSHVFHSDLTGDHTVWKVGVTEESTGNIYNYYIDKETRKIWRVDIAANGNVLFLLDKETDFNPFKNKFDKEATFKMVSAGNSTILGEAFARDDKSGKDDKNFDIGIVNFNKKQFAPKGTKVLLMPYTAYYKEWFEINKKQSKIKNAKPIPLPKEAVECIKYAHVYNDEGNFEFINLMPGEYLLFTAFGYEDTFSSIQETGRANVYMNGNYAGSEVYTDVFSFATNATASILKIVSIKTNGESVKIKLKKT